MTPRYIVLHRSPRGYVVLDRRERIEVRGAHQSKAVMQACADKLNAQEQRKESK